MHTQRSRSQSARFTVRVLIGILSVFFTLVSIRLIDLQLFRGSVFRAQADSNRFFTQRIPAPRGEILDRYGEPLVWNTQTYTYLDDPLALFPTGTRISREEALQRIATQSAQSVEISTERRYRYPQSLAHVVGYVAPVTAQDLQRQPTLYPGQSIGKVGLEQWFEERLRGVAGKRVFEVNALGKKQRIVEEYSPITGGIVHTTLDPALSARATELLEGKRGAVVVVDVETGDILTLVSAPTFDPNLLSQVMSDSSAEADRRERVRALFSDERKVFFHRGVAGAYPPGSIFKLITAVAALESGNVTRETQVVDEGVLRVGDFEFRNWFYRQYGRVDGSIGLVRALARSNDIFFYKAAELAGPDAIGEVASQFGFGKKTGVELAGEVSGLLPTREWKLRERGERWYLGNTYHFGIGQGDLSVTPIQIAQMTQALAKNGSLCTLSLEKKQTPVCTELGVDQGLIDQVIEGMIGACSLGGTAFPFFSHNESVRAAGQIELTPSSIARARSLGAVACKTGTAEFGGQNAQGFRNTHGWFTMFVQLPDDARRSELPREVGITVLVESDELVPYREGSGDAAPIAFSLMSWMMEKENATVPVRVAE